MKFWHTLLLMYEEFYIPICIWAIFESIYLPHTRMLPTCVGVIAWQVRKIDVLNSVLLMTHDRSYALHVGLYARDHVIDKKRVGWERKKKGGWLFSQYDDSVSIILCCFQCIAIYLHFECIFRPFAFSQLLIQSISVAWYALIRLLDIIHQYYWVLFQLILAVVYFVGV